MNSDASILGFTILVPVGVSFLLARFFNGSNGTQFLAALISIPLLLLLGMWGGFGFRGDLALGWAVVFVMIYSPYWFFSWIIAAIISNYFFSRRNRIGDFEMNWKKITFLAFCIFAFPVVMTSAICHSRFLWHWHSTGQCSASDVPSEVFMSFAILGGGTVLVVGAIWAAFSRIIKVAR